MYSRPTSMKRDPLAADVCILEVPLRRLVLGFLFWVDCPKE